MTYRQTYTRSEQEAARKAKNGVWALAAVAAMLLMISLLQRGWPG
jgi:hypothetical protein